LELDYIPNLWEQTQSLASVGQWDYIIGSIHFVGSLNNGSPWTIDGSNDEFKKGFAEVFDNNSPELIRKFFALTQEMVTVMKPDIIGHIDKLKMQHTPECFVSDTDPVFRQELLNTLDLIASSGSIIEINTRGMYRRNEPEFYPGNWAIQEMAKRNIPVTINSDAHKPEEISKLHDKALKLIYDSGYRKVRVLYKGEWQDQSI
jgi:histidinol-phosphatase (PHP family)